MYVYVAQFGDRSGAIKIGTTEKFEERLNRLVQFHGTLKECRVFNIGVGCRGIEAFLHSRYRSKAVSLPKCDGYREFFAESIKQDVLAFLKAVEDNAPHVDEADYVHTPRDMCKKNMGRPLAANALEVVSWRKANAASISTTANHFGISGATVKRYCAAN